MNTRMQQCSVRIRRLDVSDEDVHRSTRQLRTLTVLIDRMHAELRILDLADDLQTAGIHGIARYRSRHECDEPAASRGFEHEQHIVGLGDYPRSEVVRVEKRLHVPAVCRARAIMHQSDILPVRRRLYRWRGDGNQRDAIEQRNNDAVLRAFRRLGLGEHEIEIVVLELAKQLD